MPAENHTAPTDVNVLGVYLTPAIYTPSMVPEAMRPVLLLNPFSHLIWCYQDACYFGRFEHPLSWVLVVSGSVLLFSVGYRFFGKLKVCFGSVL